MESWSFAQGKLCLRTRGAMLLLDSGCLQDQFDGIICLMPIMWQQSWTKKNDGSDSFVHKASQSATWINHLLITKHWQYWFYLVTIL